MSIAETSAPNRRREHEQGQRNNITSRDSICLNGLWVNRNSSTRDLMNPHLHAQNFSFTTQRTQTFTKSSTLKLNDGHHALDWNSWPSTFSIVPGSALDKSFICVSVSLQQHKPLSCLACLTLLSQQTGLVRG